MNSQRVAYGICALLLISIAIDIPAAVRTGDWMYVFQILMALVAIILPFLLEIRHKLFVPPVTKIILMVFIYGAQFLGSVKDVYHALDWWDSFMHFISGPTIGLLGYSFVRQMRARSDGTRGMPIGMALLFVFSFVMMVGAMWELVEFGIDQALGQDMQRGSLFDTMYDTIFNLIGAVLITVAAALQMKGHIRFLDRLALRSGKPEADS